MELMGEQQVVPGPELGPDGRKLRVFFPYHAKVICVEVVHDLTWEDEDEAERALPLPKAPVHKDGGPDFNHPDFIRAKGAVLAERMLWLVGKALGPGFCGGAEEMKDRVAYLKRKYRQGIIVHLYKSLENPVEATEEEVRAEMVRQYPTYQLQMGAP